MDALQTHYGLFPKEPHQKHFNDAIYYLIMGFGLVLFSWIVFQIFQPLSLWEPMSSRSFETTQGIELPKGNTTIKIKNTLLLAEVKVFISNKAETTTASQLTITQALTPGIYELSLENKSLLFQTEPFKIDKYESISQPDIGVVLLIIILILLGLRLILKGIIQAYKAVEILYKIRQADKNSQ